MWRSRASANPPNQRNIQSFCRHGTQEEGQGLPGSIEGAEKKRTADESNKIKRTQGDNKGIDVEMAEAEVEDGGTDQLSHPVLRTKPNA